MPALSVCDLDLNAWVVSEANTARFTEGFRGAEGREMCFSNSSSKS